MITKKPFVGFVGPAYSARSPRHDCQKLINMYIEIDPIGTGKDQEPAVLIGTPGLEYIQTMGVGPIRATYTLSNQEVSYIVSGDEVYQISGAAAIPIRVIGNLTTTAGPVQIADNGIQVLFIDGVNGYYLTIGETTPTASTPAFEGVGDGSASDVTIIGTPPSETWTLTATTSTNFTVIGSVSGAQSDLTVGTLYTNAFFSITLTQGATVYSVDDTYTFDITEPNTLNTIVDPNFYPASTVTFQDGYFILNQNGTTNFFISDLYSIDFLPLNQAAKTGNSDILNAVISNNRQVYLLGANTSELWYDAGVSGSTPFQRQDGRFSQVGCVAPASIAKLGEAFFWLGSNQQGGGIVYMIQDTMPQRVSTHAMEFLIQAAGDLSQATGYAYQQEGHYFYALNIPTLPMTLVYDMASEQWHVRQSTVRGTTGRNLGSTHCVLNDIHIMGDYRNGNIYKLNLDCYTDNGDMIARIRQAPHMASSLYTLFMTLFEIDFQFGVGLVNNGSNPQNAVNPRVILEVSTDGGQTFKNPIYAKLGKIGKWRTRAQFFRCGSGRDIVCRITVTDPVKVQMLGAVTAIRQGFA